MIDCPKCRKNVIPNTENRGRQTEARCPYCGTFIKWLGKTDRKRLEGLQSNNKKEPDYSDQMLHHISNQLNQIIQLLKER